MVVVATHRRSTAAHADRIYQIANGRLVNAGDSAFDAAREVKIA
jgi:ABC-type transport system involved in cytochrome bd biosynthesis fused ATPase/permease subunit